MFDYGGHGGVPVKTETKETQVNLYSNVATEM